MIEVVTAQHIALELSSTFGDQTDPIIVGIDGPDCSGKSTLAQLTLCELKQDFSVVVIHFDDYLNSPATRERKGTLSLEAFYYDYFDWETMTAGIKALRSLPSDLLNFVIVEGLFLFTPERRGIFDYRIRLEIDDKLLLERALARDVGHLGDEAWVRTHYLQQCIPAQKFYLNDCNPRIAADMHLRCNQFGDYEQCR